MTRAALLTTLSLVVACSPDPPQLCPGEPVGRFTFDPAMLATSPLPGGLDPDPTLRDCAAALGFPEPLPSFEGTLAADAATSAAALCRSTGLVMFGTRSGLRWSVEASSGGAVLGACGPTCAAASRLVISGDVLPDATSPEEFRGALVEQLTLSEGDCGACELPCAARYTLVGTEASP